MTEARFFSNQGAGLPQASTWIPKPWLSSVEATLPGTSYATDGAAVFHTVCKMEDAYPATIQFIFDQLSFPVSGSPHTNFLQISYSCLTKLQLNPTKLAL
ncbi:MAG: hypothetical protein A3I66_20670 [Burkholderiales bacterium RIFCSPLOWO2_02_FULL_57_36]|nr:MAG: hypothetical protein A3I66_20670 [Burkholderiales bacterium RIFCSPLOWO2_02_FULL_57_36]